MSLVLYMIGIIVFIISIIMGFLHGTFWGLLIAVAGGISSSIIFFALAKILDNQELILFKLVYQEEIYRKSFVRPKVVCPKCNYEHDDDYSSCPHCGYRY